jgi:hypothetical protein
MSTKTHLADAAEGNAHAADPVHYMRNGRPKLLPKRAPNETVQIALKVSQGDLDLIDAAATGSRLSRAAFIRTAIFGYMDTKQN